MTGRSSMFRRPRRGPRADRYHRLRGRDLAAVETGYDDQVLGYSRIRWTWSLRSTGEVWYRKLRVEYKEQRADGSVRYVPARRKEPVHWQLARELTLAERGAIANGEETPERVLRQVTRAEGHYPLGTQPAWPPAEPLPGSPPPVPEPPARREPDSDVISFGPPR